MGLRGGEDGGGGGGGGRGGLDLVTTRLADVLKWGRKFSIFQYPFVTACCAMEYMSVSAAAFDTSRFGAEIPRFSPRQSDLLFVVGTVTHRNAPVLRRVYDQMADPKWVIAFGACACSGGFYQNYAAVQGVDRIIPVDVYIPGCPPRPEAILDGILLLQEQIQREPVDAPLRAVETLPELPEGVGGGAP